MTTNKWLASNRTVEYLFVLAEMSRVRQVVSHDWISACLDLQDIAAGAAYALTLPAEFAAARERGPRLLAGNVLFFGGKLDSVAAAHKDTSNKATGYAAGKLSADKRDLVVLASLHGAEVSMCGFVPCASVDRRRWWTFSIAHRFCWVRKASLTAATGSTTCVHASVRFAFACVCVCVCVCVCLSVRLCDPPFADAFCLQCKPRQSRRALFSHRKTP